MKKQLKNIFLICVWALFFAATAIAQQTKSLNLPGYDKEKLHFGFSLSVNQADFALYRAAATSAPDSIMSVNSMPDYGFNLGIVSDLRLHEYLTLRFLPALSFQSRILEYNIHSPSTPNVPFYTETKRVESTLLDFPILLKLRSERLNNMSAYLLGGGKFSVDLASQAKTKNPDIVKLTNKDWSVEAGFGLDFYLEYFKLSTEVKFSAGLGDRLYHDGTPFTSPIGNIFTKAWIFSLNFEG